MRRFCLSVFSLAQRGHPGAACVTKHYREQHRRIPTVPSVGGSDLTTNDVLGAPSHSAFHERMQQVIHKLRSRLYSVYRPVEFIPHDFELLLSACERHGDPQYVPVIIGTFASMLRQPLPPTAVKNISAWDDGTERLSKCVRRASKLLSPTDALNMIRRNVLALPEDFSNSAMWKEMLAVLQGREAAEDSLGDTAAKPKLFQKKNDVSLDLGIVASIAGALVRQGEKDAAMELAEASVLYRLRLGHAIRDVEAVASECAEAAAMIGNAELVARFSFVMFRSCGALGSTAPIVKQPSPLSFTEWWKARARNVVSKPENPSPDVFEESLAQVLASAIRVSFVTVDPDKGISDAISLCNKLKNGASWDSHSAMVVTILQHLCEQHSGIAGDKTTAMQTSAINLLASLAERFPRDFTEKQQSVLAQCVVLVMTLFSSSSFVVTSDGRMLKVDRALNAIRIVELFSQLPVNSQRAVEFRRRTLHLMLAGCAGLGDWEAARRAVQEVVDPTMKYPGLLGCLAKSASDSADTVVASQAALALLCEMFCPQAGPLPDGLVVSDDVLLLLAHSLVIASRRPSSAVVINKLLQLVILQEKRSQPISLKTSNEIVLAALSHRQPVDLSLLEGHALCRALLRLSLGVEWSSLFDWKLLSPSNGISFSTGTGFSVGHCPDVFGVAVVVDISAIGGPLPQLVAGIEAVVAEALRRSLLPPSSCALVAFSWAAMQEGVACYGRSFTDLWSASKTFCVLSPFLLPASCRDLSDVTDAAAGLAHCSRRSEKDETYAAVQSRIFLWIEAEPIVGEAKAPGLFQTLSRRKMSVSKALHDVRHLLTLRPSVQATHSKGALNNNVAQSNPKAGVVVSSAMPGTRSLEASASAPAARN